jgi:GNAT superfamily N-acetyltransferase
VVDIITLERDRLAEARALLETACDHDEAGIVAEEKLFAGGLGPPSEAVLGAIEDGALLGVAVASGKWLRLIAVSPLARRRGIGSALLDAAEKHVRSIGEPTIRTGDQPGNYLGPGFAKGNAVLLAWLGRRGYVQRRENTNLLIDVATNDRVSRQRAIELAEAAANSGYEIRRAEPGEVDWVAREITAAFTAGWAREVTRAITNNDPCGAHIAIKDARLAAFAAHDGNNSGLGWFGPAGTKPDHRRRGLGEALLIACLADIADAGHDIATIAWIGPREFYARAAGVSGERHYVVMTKELSK